MKKSHCKSVVRMQRDTTVGIPIFPSDGTSRIRFTGQSQQAHSQPDTSGPPKTYLLGVADIIPKSAKNVKVFVILSERSESKDLSLSSQRY